MFSSSLNKGGGFDFVHSMLLYPSLRKMKKNVFFLSYSFGVMNKITKHAPVFFEASENGIFFSITCSFISVLSISFYHLQQILLSCSSLLFCPSSSPGPICKKVTKKTEAGFNYRPEIGYLQFLHKLFPEEDHFIYACCARDWVRNERKRKKMEI